MSICVVNITFKRIQQFLFAVPRLKAMLGANAILGEAIRHDLVELVANYKYYKISQALPPAEDAADPLDDDDPQTLYKKGIISRDGGHFTAAFDNEDDANNFINAARELIAKKLPGVQIEAILKVDGKAEENIQTNSNWGETSTRLPQFLICEDSGDEIANNERDEEPKYVSNKVTHLEKAGKKFKDNQTKDIISLLKNHLPNKKTDTQELLPPEDLDQLVGINNYIAVVHADGNSMGVRRKIYADVGQTNQGKNKKFNFDSYIQNEVKNEEFFHAMRTTVRKSVIKALETVFNKTELQKYSDKQINRGIKSDEVKLPYQLLMLGGDDLLLITQPEYAFPFVLEYSKELEKYKIPYKNEKKEISIGAGIAIAHHKVPFYHLHHLAENLADSAKKLYRSQQANDEETPEERSVVDWMVATTSWIDDIEQNRRSYDLSEDSTHCITAKPYFVLQEKNTKEGEENQNQDTFCLATLWNAASQIAKTYKQDENDQTSDKEKLPRSKLKGLLQPITTFNREMSDKHYKNITPPPPEFKRLFPDQSPWLEIEENKYLTQYKDLMELIEVHFLGRQTKSTNVADEESQTTSADSEEVKSNG